MTENESDGDAHVDATRASQGCGAWDGEANDGESTCGDWFRNGTGAGEDGAGGVGIRTQRQKSTELVRLGIRTYDGTNAKQQQRK